MLFDTDILIWALRGNKKAALVIDQADFRFISSVSYMELLKGARNKNELKSIRQFLKDLRFTTIPIEKNICHRATIYMEEFVLSSGLDMADALIAATSAENSETLYTANCKHYKIIPDLQIKVFRP